MGGDGTRYSLVKETISIDNWAIGSDVAIAPHSDGPLNAARQAVGRPIGSSRRSDSMGPEARGPRNQAKGVNTGYPGKNILVCVRTVMAPNQKVTMSEQKSCLQSNSPHLKANVLLSKPKSGLQSSRHDLKAKVDENSLGTLCSKIDILMVDTNFLRSVVQERQIRAMIKQ